MKRKLYATLSLALVLAMAFVLGACGNSGDNNAKVADEKTPASSAAQVETGEYQGTLLTAYQHEMVLSGDEGDMEFVTSKDTVYNLGDVDGMYLDDTVAVKYHVGDDGNMVDEVAIVEHMEEALTFAGTLVDSDKGSVTLLSGDLTVTFQIDSDTYLVGDLSYGDGIELTYYGDLSEYPYANVVTVVTEAAQPDVNTARGNVSELSDGTMLLAIDSANAYRFNITKSTEVTGEASDIMVGDRVAVTYKGSIKSQPDAQGVKIVKTGQERPSVINGKVTRVKKKSLTFKTSKAKYTVATNSSTKYYGAKPAKGYRAEITYTGDLKSKPVATIVYCVKSEKAAKKEGAKKAAAAKKAVERASASASGVSASKQEAKTADEGTETKQTEAADEQTEAADEQTDSKSDSMKTQETEIEEQPADTEEAEAEPDLKVSGKGTIISGDEKAQTVDIELQDGTKITLSFDDDTTISSGYNPEKGDVVKIVYGSNSMLLKDIQLISREAEDEDAPADTSDDDAADAKAEGEDAK